MDRRCHQAIGRLQESVKTESTQDKKMGVFVVAGRQCIATQLSRQPLVVAQGS